MELGCIIRLLRLEKGIKQESMAEKLGISQSAYSRYENGQTRLHVHTIEKIASELEVSLEELYKKAHHTISLPVRAEMTHQQGIADEEKALYLNLLREKERQYEVIREENLAMKDKILNMEKTINALAQQVRQQDELLCKVQLQIERSK
jgi:transcriptional regulator with XRE-family HTH domain